MSGKKHIFKMVPGKSFVIEEAMTCHPGKNICLSGTFSSRDSGDFSKPYKIAKLAFMPLNDESTEVLTLNVNFCQFHERAYISLNGLGRNLKPSISYHKDCTDNSLIYLNDQLVNLTASMRNDGSRYDTANFVAQSVVYQYVMRDENGKYYFSDREGNIIVSSYDKALQKNIVPCSEKEAKEIVNNMLDDIPEHLLKKLDKDNEVVSGDDIDIEDDGWHAPYSQGTDTRVMMAEYISEWVEIL